jgi:hypothetical protein
MQLAWLSNIPSLRTLDLSQTTVNDSSADVLARFHLDVLNLSRTVITPECVESLKVRLPHTQIVTSDWL